MIHLEILNSNLFDVLGHHQYQWDDIQFGGPQGLHLTKESHPPLRFKIIPPTASPSELLLQVEGEHFLAPVQLNGIPTSLPLLCRVQDLISWGSVEIRIVQFTPNQFQNLDQLYREKRAPLNEQSPEWPLLKELMKGDEEEKED